MAWGWVHNFPTSKDTFTKPIDYPTAGWGTMIADWWEDVFNAVGAMQDALGYDITGGYADLNTRLATFSSLTVAETEVFNGLSPEPPAWTDLDLSGVVGSNPALVLLKFWNADEEDVITFRKDGDTDDFLGAIPTGCSAGEAEAGIHCVFLVATSDLGVIEWIFGRPGVSCTIDIIAYIN